MCDLKNYLPSENIFILRNALLYEICFYYANKSLRAINISHLERCGNYHVTNKISTGLSFQLSSPFKKFLVLSSPLNMNNLPFIKFLKIFQPPSLPIIIKTPHLFRIGEWYDVFLTDFFIIFSSISEEKTPQQDSICFSRKLWNCFQNTTNFPQP